MRFEEKVVVVTGAASGMGREMVRIFAAEGAKVIGADWHAPALEQIVAEITAAGGTIKGVQGNVAQETDCARIIAAATESFGRLDVLCNNAGVMDTNQGIGELTNDMWERVLGINLYGPMYLSRLAVPIMVEQHGGAIVNTGSLAGLGGGAAGAAYTISKHGLIGLTRSTAFVYTHDGIRCNAIAAGAVKTDIMQSVDLSKMDPKGSARFNTWYAAIPAQLEARDVANVAVFLASDAAIGINGAIIPVDAAWSAA